jgi:putative transposase
LNDYTALSESEKQNSTGSKKNCNLSHAEKKGLITPPPHDFPVTKQSELLGISRSSFYYVPKENPADKRQMDMIDKIYTAYPFYGSRRIGIEMKDRFQEKIGRERTQYLMRKMGIKTIYPKKMRNTSFSDPTHQKYPYLLKDLTALSPNHVWGTDITYIKMEEGWAYLVALLDWFLATLLLGNYHSQWKQNSALRI